MGDEGTASRCALSTIGSLEERHLAFWGAPEPDGDRIEGSRYWQRRDAPWVVTAIKRRAVVSPCVFNVSQTDRRGAEWRTASACGRPPPLPRVRLWSP